jgi:hypothetical protein
LLVGSIKLRELAVILIDESNCVYSNLRVERSYKN